MDRLQGSRGGLLLTIVILASSGCAAAAPAATPTDSGGSEPSPSLLAETPEPTATLTPPSPTPDLGALGQAYLALVEASNAILCAANARIEAAPDDLALFAGAYRDFASADRQLADGLRLLTLPEPVQTHVNDMVVKLAAAEAAYLSVASSTTWEEVDLYLQRALDANAETVALSNLIRADLALSSVPGSC